MHLVTTAMPHPMCDYMRTNALLKMGLPFAVCIAALTSYSAMDNLLPTNATYAGVEYAPSPAKVRWDLK